MATKKQPLKKEVKEIVRKDDEILIKLTEQVNILYDSIVRINEDMGTIYDKVERLCKRMGI